jgi:hypothetical protein
MENDQSIALTQVDQALEDKQYNYVEKLLSMSGLPKAMEYVLREEMSDYMSESPRRTAKEIAETVGVHVQTVYTAHRDSRYLDTKDKIQDIYFQSKANIFYEALIDSAQSGKVGAIKLGLQITGKHVDRIETKNVNVNADIATFDSGIEQTVDRFLIMLGNKAWSLEMIADRWRVLKESQAF